MAKETLKDRLQRETLEMVVEQVDEITAQLERLDRQDQVIGKLSQQVDVIDLTVANLRSTLEQANSSIADLRAINQTTREEFIALKARLEAQQAPQGGSVHIHGDVGGDVGGEVKK